MKIRLVPALVFCFYLASLLTPVRAQQGAGLKVYISVDMEGAVGVVTGDQLGPGGFEYARFREFMTDEAVTECRTS